MPITKKQLNQILDAIEKRMLTFSVDVIGEVSLSPEELRRLKSFGIIRKNVKNMVVDATNYGRLVALLPESIRGKLSLSDIEKMSSKLKPMTDVEKNAIEYSKIHSGEYIKGLKDTMLKDVRTTIVGQSLEALRETMVSSISERKTVSELKTALFDLFDDRNRDWRRVASTEINNSIQFGIAASIKEASDEEGDQLVFKRPNPDACKHCLRLFLQQDGTPKIFKIGDLAISNVGKKANDWLPTVGGVHPFCHCQLHVVPDGFGFKKRSTASTEFVDNGKKYKAGQQISDSELAGMSEINKRKIKQESILEFEGDDNV